MKKRMVAILLSAAMCMTPVTQAAAADFSSGPAEETTVELPAAEETVQQEETVPAEETEADPFGDVFTSGETAETEAEGESTFSTEEETEPFGDGTVTTEEPTPEASLPPEQEVRAMEVTEDTGIPVVYAEQGDWIEENGKFRLVKPVEEVPTAEETPAAEEEVPTEEETPAAEEEVPAAEEVPTAEDAQVMETVSASAVQLMAAAEEAPGVESTADELPEANAEAEPEFYTEQGELVLVYTTNDEGVTHSGYYLFDENGYMVTGENSTLENQEYYFIEAEAATMYAECEGGEMTPATSNVGRVAVKLWKWSSTRFVYYGENGQIVTDISGLKSSNGFYAIDSAYYNLKNDGTPQTGDAKVGQKVYHFSTDKEADGRYGKMVVGKWLSQENKNRWRYFGSDGVWAQKGIHVTTLDASMGSATYLLDANGYLIRSRVATAANNVLYGANGSGQIYKNGPAKLGGVYYYFDGNGAAVKNKLIEYKGKRYYFTGDGTRATWKKCWHWCEGAGRYYYFGKNPGVVKERSGWRKLKLNGEFEGWLYFKKNGRYYDHYINQVVDGKYFTADGTLASGVEKYKGKYYFYTESTSKTRRGDIVKKQLISWNGDLYYATKKGRLYTKGWKKLNGSYYYFQKDGTALKKAFIEKNGVNGYLDSTGRFTTGWVVINNAKNKVRYLSPDKKGYLKNCTKTINGQKFTFDSKGYRVNDVSKKYKGPYYIEVDRVNCVMTVYTDSSKRIPVKSIRVSVGLPGTATPTGTYTLRPSLRWQPLMGPSWGQYGTHVQGAGQGGIFIHSVSGAWTTINCVPKNEYYKLGQPASHGCIRTCVADAKWVYYNCGGSTIRIFDGNYTSLDALKGPLGKPALKPMKAPYNTDPTDPLA